jgi:3,4-dihydroxy 2-butanone 4-phosphate synthase/GTP cyclohydrolase II
MNNTIQSALKEFKAGSFLIVTDDEGRENEGDLILLGSAATSEKVAFMVRHTSGVLCLATTRTHARRLKLPLMVRKNQDSKKTQFTVSVDVKTGNTTGISAIERGNTIRALSDLNSIASDFVRPGHLFPLVANDGGLLARQGHTEAAVALAIAVGEYPAAVISEIVNEDGTMMRGSQLKAFGLEHEIVVVSIEDLIKELPSEAVGAYPKDFHFEWAELPRSGGTWKIATYPGASGAEHAIMQLGVINTNENVMLRLHSECLTGDALGSARCDCGPQLDAAMAKIEANGSGLLLYMHDHEGRGIGLAEKIKAYQLQDQGLDTIDANLQLGHESDERNWQDAVEILEILDVRKIDLLTNNPDKLRVLKAAGLEVTAIPLKIESSRWNAKYLQTKRDRMGHLI